MLVLIKKKLFFKKSKKFLWHFFLFAVLKTYRTVTPVYGIEPNREFCGLLHPYYSYNFLDS